MAQSNGRFFTTKDQDNDRWSGHNCANHYYGGWWYNDCLPSNLNGKYFMNGRLEITGVVWKAWKDNYYSMMEVEMKIRPLKFA